MLVKGSRSSRDWRLIHVTGDRTAVVDALIDALRPVPGIKVDETPAGVFLDCPRNVWALPGFVAIWALTEATLDDGVAVETAFQPARRPFSHQVDGARFIADAGGALLADDMGLGKTTTAILAAEGFGTTRPRLVLGPLFVREAWHRELLALGAIEGDRDFCVFEGRDQSRVPANIDARWWFCHYDVADAWSGWFRLNRRGRPVVAILDEAHWVKNGRAGRSAAANAVATTCDYRILLTGTPFENRTAELWHLLTILDGPQAWGTPSDFRRRYCGAYHDGYGLVDGAPTNVEELRARLARRYLRRELGDAGVELPPLRRQPLWVEMDEETRRAHDTIVGGNMKAMVEALVRGSGGEETFGLLAKIRKCTSEAKAMTTVAFTKNILQQDASAVVFTWERAMAKKLGRSIGDAAIVVTGADPIQTREAAINAFQHRGGALVATIDCLKEGVTLHRGTHVVMHDLPWKPNVLAQAEKRIHRIGQQHACLSTWVMARDSFDTIVAEALARKAEQAAEVMDLAASKEALGELGLVKPSGQTWVEDEVRELLAAW